MKTILLTTAWEIFDLSGVQGVDIGVARDMFCENLSTWEEGQTVHYAGAGVDYGKLSPIHDIFLQNGVIMVEYLDRTLELPNGKVRLTALPLKVRGADGFPARVIAEF